MALDTSALVDVIKQSDLTGMATKAVGSSVTADFLISNKSVTVGVKGSARINKMSNTANFQSGAGCGARSVVGDTVFTEKSVTVVPIKDIQNICVEAMIDTYYASMVAQGQDPETESLDAKFVKAVMEDRANVIGAQVEKLIWQGDTVLTGTNNLKWMNGFIKVIANAADELNITPTGSTVTAKLQSFYAQMPIDVRKQADFRIFISEELYDSYLIELDAANKFRENTAFKLSGTTATLQVTPGLNGQTKAVAALISDLHMGIDGTGDIDKASLKYSMETEQWYADFHFALGVQVIHTNQVGVATIA